MLHIKSVVKYKHTHITKMHRPQDITFKFVVKDEELKQLYVDNLKNYKFGDRGIDLIVPQDARIYINKTTRVDHKIQVAAYYTFDDGIEYEVGYDLRLRSGTAAKTPFRLANSVGTIDLYRGNTIALIDYTSIDLGCSLLGKHPYPLLKNSTEIKLNDGEVYIVDYNYSLVTRGTRLVQLVNPNGFGCIVEFVDELPPTERDDKGFGSSGGI